MSNKKNKSGSALWLAIAALLCGVDQYIKYLTVIHIKPIASQVFIPGVLRLTYVENRGAAFGMLQNQKWLFMIVTVLAVGWMVWYVTRHSNSSKFLLCSLSLVLAGAMGNAIDRVANSYVVDMFEPVFINFAVFNFADACVSVGVGMLFIYILFMGKNQDGDNAGAEIADAVDEVTAE